MAIRQANLGNIKGATGLPGGQGAPGRDGYDGRKINFRGRWAAGTSYLRDVVTVDVVDVDGEYYYCKKSNSRTVSPKVDTVYWGKFRGGSFRFIEEFTIETSDWSSTGEGGVTAYRARIASNIPTTWYIFLQEIISPDVKETNGIFFDDIETNGDAIFYASSLPAADVTISLWYCIYDNEVIEAMPEEQPTEIYLAVNDDNGNRLQIIGWHDDNLPVDYGDGEVSFQNTHTYESNGNYTVKIKGQIGGTERGFFGELYSENRTIVGARFFSNTKLAPRAFEYCVHMESVMLPGGMPAIPNGAFYYSGLMSVSFPDDTVRIKSSAFSNCSRLAEVKFNFITDIEDDAFDSCISLTEANMPYVRTIGSTAFDGCMNLTSIKMPMVESIGTGAFRDCRRISEITIPYGVTEVPDYMCYNCTNLSKAYLPSSITRIGGRAFYSSWYDQDYPIDTMEIYFGGTRAQWEAIEKGTNWGNRTVHCIDD